MRVLTGMLAFALFSCRPPPAEPHPDFAALPALAAPDLAQAPTPDLMDPYLALLRRVASMQGDPGHLKALVAMAKQEPVTWAQAAKNPARYVGRPWVYTVRILQIREQQNTEALVQVGYNPTAFMHVLLPGQTDYVQGDVVDLAGYIADEFTAASGARMPSLIGLAMRPRGSLIHIRYGE